ncbi:hypothetical protein C1646_764245 [Rhizophagus diaphanus]|nr:hypothetical protein C1646_764245 [Rhizophagus diaphanus] [Rhizophagus sp. MUCL 43196]
MTSHRVQLAGNYHTSIPPRSVVQLLLNCGKEKEDNAILTLKVYGMSYTIMLRIRPCSSGLDTSYSISTSITAGLNKLLAGVTGGLTGVITISGNSCYDIGTGFGVGVIGVLSVIISVLSSLAESSESSKSGSESANVSHSSASSPKVVVRRMALSKALSPNFENIACKKPSVTKDFRLLQTAPKNISDISSAI